MPRSQSAGPRTASRPSYYSIRVFRYLFRGLKRQFRIYQWSQPSLPRRLHPVKIQYQYIAHPGSSSSSMRLHPRELSEHGNFTLFDHGARNFPSFSFSNVIRSPMACCRRWWVRHLRTPTSAPREDHRTKVSPSKATFGDLTCGAPRISCSEALYDSV